MKSNVSIWAASFLLASALAVPAQNCSYTINVPSGYSMIANHCDNGGTPWMDIPNATNPYTAPATGEKKFYRVSP